MIRIGHSTDTHRLAPGHKLIIGGIPIVSEKGSVGHSDGDCLLHTVAESLIGALSLGDLGAIFPDNSEDFKDIDSSLLVVEVMKQVKARGYKVLNIDSTVNLERPKLRKYIASIREHIASLLEIDVEYVSVKATTGERIGIVGREEAVVTESVVLVTND